MFEIWKRSSQRYEFQVFWIIKMIGIVNQYKVSTREFKSVSLSVLQSVIFLTLQIKNGISQQQIDHWWCCFPNMRENSQHLLIWFGKLCLLPEYFIVKVSILYVKLRSMLAEIARTEYFKIKGNTNLVGQCLDHAEVSWHHSYSERCYKALPLILLLIWRNFDRIVLFLWQFLSSYNPLTLVVTYCWNCKHNQSCSKLLLRNKTTSVPSGQEGRDTNKGTVLYF